MDRSRQGRGAKNALVFAIVIIIAGILLLSTYSSSSSDAAAKVRALYELANPGTSVEIISISQESGVYKAVIKSESAQGTNYKEAYFTKDGNLLFESAIFVQNTTGQIARMRDFVDCLDKRGVRIYGVLNQTLSMAGATATSLQLQALGVYSGKIYVSCDGEALQGCLAAGIQQVPSAAYNGTVYSGAKAPAFFGELTGCRV